MKNYLLFFFFIVAPIIFTACASAGHTFKYQNRNTLVLKKSASNEAVSNLGRPSVTKTVSNANGDYVILTYVYAYAAAGSGSTSRALILEFKGDVLNAMVYNSGFEEDKTAFNMEAAGKIEKNRSTKEDVLRLLGNPPGKAICPTSIYDYSKYPNTAEIWTWEYTKKSKISRKEIIKTDLLKLLFDKNGIVIDKELFNNE